MGKKACAFMRGRFGILWCMAVLLSAMFPAKVLLAGQEQVDCPPLAGAQGVDKCSLSERTQRKSANSSQLKTPPKKHKSNPVKLPSGILRVNTQTRNTA